MKNEPSVLKDLTYKIAVKRAEVFDKAFEEITPKWYQWCIKRGGLFRWFAKKVVYVIIVQESLK
jgi:hypothetical protein